MKIHLLALAALLAVALVRLTNAFVVTFPGSKTPASKGRISTCGSFNKNYGLLKKIESTLANASPAITRLLVFQDSENDESVSLDAQAIYFNEENMATSLTLAEADVLQDPSSVSVETEMITTSQQQLKAEEGMSSETATTLENSKVSSASPPSIQTQVVGGGALEGLVATPGFTAGASIGSVAFGGLAVARGLLGQRQKKLDEEKRNIEEQQQRLEEEAAKLQQDTSQNNLFLSTIGSVAVGAVLSTGGLVEELTESTVRSLEGIVGETSLENNIKESAKGGVFKTTAGTIIERPALSQQELPYLENKIEQSATKQQTKQRSTKALTNKRDKLSLKQNELENMTIKRETAIATEEARLKAIADEEERLRAEEEALRRRMLAEKNEAARLKKEAEAAREKAAEAESLRKEAEEARIKKEAEEARIKKEAEEARIKKEAEEARIKKEKEVEEERIREEKKKAEQLRIQEEETKEKARQEAITREQRALEILRQQEEELVQQKQLSTGNSATAAGANILREYVSRFNGVFVPTQLSPTVDTEKLQLLLNQLGISPGIAGGITATLVVGGGVTAINRIINDAKENEDMVKEGVESKDDDNESNVGEDDTLSSQVAKLLEINKERTAGQPSTVRKTLKISIEATDDNSTFSISKKSDSQSSSSNKAAPSGASSSVSSTQKKSPSSSTGPPSFITPSETNTKTTRVTETENKFGSPPKKFGRFSGEQANSPPGAVPKIAAPGKNPSSQFGTSPPKSGSFSTFGSPSSKAVDLPSKFGSPPKTFGRFSGEKTNFSPGAVPKVAVPGKNPSSPFDTSPPKAGSFSTFGSPSSKAVDLPKKLGTPPKKIAEPPSEKAKSPFGSTFPNDVSRKQPSSPFGTSPPNAGSFNTFGSPSSKAAEARNKFGISPKKIAGPPSEKAKSPFGSTFSNSEVSGKQPSSSFGTFPPKGGSFNTFGSSPSKAAESPNKFGISPKKIAGPPGVKAKPPFGSTFSNDEVSGKQPSSPFGTKLDAPNKKTDSLLANSSKSTFLSSPKDNTKKPFSPFSQRNASPKTSKPSFQAGGPVYMPPAPKASNAAPLNDLYSSLDSKQKKSTDGALQTGMKPEVKEIPFSSSRDSDMPPDVTNPISSVGILPGSPSRPEQGSKKTYSPYGLKRAVSAPNPNSKTTSPTSDATVSQGQGVKKSYSPYGRKPKQRAENLSKLDPSKFSFGAPSTRPASLQDPVNPTSTSSFSFGPVGASSVPISSSASKNDPVSPDGSGVSDGRESYGTAPVPKPFAATGFPPRSNTAERNQKDGKGSTQPDRFNDKENTRDGSNS